MIDAIKAGEISGLQALIDRGEDLDRQDKNGKTPLHIAVIYDKPEAVNMLVKFQAELNIKDENGFTPLHFATQLNRSEIARTLINAGARINTVTCKLDTPLSFATWHGDRELINLLLSKLARLDVQDFKDDTPLIIAAKRGYNDVVSLYIDNLAPANKRDAKKNNCLHYLLIQKKIDIEVVNKVYRAGCDFFAKNEDGITPFDLLEKYVKKQGLRASKKLLNYFSWRKLQKIKRDAKAAERIAKLKKICKK